MDSIPNQAPDLGDPAAQQVSEDFYFDGPNVVFTAAFLLKCGACCRSGCRHCPYGFTKPEETAG
jgi:hypothetical protein